MDKQPTTTSIVAAEAEAKPITERLPVECFAVVEAFADDPQGLVAALEMDDIEVTREEARQLIRFVTDEDEADLLSGAPSSTEILQSQTDIMLRDELSRLMEEQKVLKAVAKKPVNDEFGYRVKGYEEIMMPEQARMLLAKNVDRVISIKKALSEDVKAKNSGKQGDQNMLNLQFNLGEIVSEANERIKAETSLPPVVLSAPTP